MNGQTARIGAVTLILVSLVIAGCGSSAPEPQVAAPLHQQTTYVVQRGDTVAQIAAKYGISVSRLMAANNLSNARDLKVGQTLIIPDIHRAASVGQSGRSNAYPYHGERSARQFLWPVTEGQVSSGFGIRNGAMHDGVDIAAPVGTPVHAADNGVVIFSGKLHGYGNVVIVQHDDHYVTVYGHNQINLVNEGDHVKCGETICRIGTSGRTTGPNLHFEVREDNIAHNPLAYLPEPPAAPGITYASDAGS